MCEGAAFSDVSDVGLGTVHVVHDVVAVLVVLVFFNLTFMSFSSEHRNDL